MTTVTVEEILRSLPDLLKKVRTGETLVILENNRPFAELKPVAGIEPTKTLRPFGLAAGQFVVPDDFDAPLPDDVQRDFERG